MRIASLLFLVVSAIPALAALPKGDVVVEKAESTWVSLGEDGKLVYGADAQSNRLPDFSYVGYCSGERPLPENVPVVLTLSPQESGDDTARIQAALDEVSRLPVGADGLRGRLLLQKGEYRVAGRLHINASGVVFSGEGDGADGTIIIATGYGKPRNRRSLIDVGKAVNISTAIVADSRREIVDAFVPIGARRFTVDSVAGLAVGERVLLHRPATKEWISFIGCDRIPPRMTAVHDTYWKEDGSDKGFYYKRGGLPGHRGLHPEPGESWEDFRKRIDTLFSADKTQMNVVQQWQPEEYQMYFDRRITAIDGNTVEVDAPLVHSLEQRFGGGGIYRVTDGDRLSNIGIENMRLISEFGPPIAGHLYGEPSLLTRSENHGWNGVRILRSVDNSWVRNVTTRYFGYAAVVVMGNNITVTDCASLGQASRVEGGRRYPFVVSGQRNLVQRCKTIGGRHEFVVQALTLGPNVFVDCIGIESKGPNGPHHRYASGTLFDNVSSEHGMESRWRGNSGTGHAWAGTQTVFYNSVAPRFNLSAPAGGYAWSLGSGPAAQVQENRLVPQSLYYAQLRERLGDEALGWQVSAEALEGLGSYSWAVGEDFETDAK